LKTKGKLKVGLVFSHRYKEEAHWPRIGFDYKERGEELTHRLEVYCGEVKFIPRIAHSSEEAEEVLKDLKKENVDGFIVYMLGLWTGTNLEGDFPISNTSGAARNSVGCIIARHGYPTLFVDDLYGGSGEFLLSMGFANKENLPVVGIASSNFEDVAEGVELLKVIKSLKESKIILIAEGYYELWTDKNELEHIFGTKIEEMSFKELSDYYDNVSDKDIEYWVNRWTSNALSIVEPSIEEIKKSARMYIALKEIMKDRRADTITIDCFGALKKGLINAYPCLAFFQLNNDGFAAICEGDLDSTITYLIGSYLSGRPGFVSDPVIDISKGQIIYAHCTCTNYVNGLGRKSNLYSIRSHAENKAGAAVQSFLPAGSVVSTLKVNTQEKAIAFHKGIAKGVVEQEDRACRTKLAVEVNASKILDNWNNIVDFKWHRVTFYDDLGKKIKNIARLLNLRFIKED
jgi:L-fucose isomerase-like protein